MSNLTYGTLRCTVSSSQSLRDSHPGHTILEYLTVSLCDSIDSIAISDPVLDKVTGHPAYLSSLSEMLSAQTNPRVTLHDHDANLPTRRSFPFWENLAMVGGAPLRLPVGRMWTAGVSGWSAIWLWYVSFGVGTRVKKVVGHDRFHTKIRSFHTLLSTWSVVLGCK